MNKLPSVPTIKDLYKHSRIRLIKKRSIKKFNKYWSKYVSNDIFVEFMAKILAKGLIRRINYVELGRKLIMVDELPQGAYAHYQKDITNE